MSSWASFTRREALTIAVGSYASFIASILGALISAIRGDLSHLALYLTILASISAVKHTYSKRLCAKCPITSCPFNPRRIAKS